jgi:hypothetical protein
MLVRVLVLSPAAVSEAKIRAALGTAADEIRIVVPVVEQSRLDWLTNDDGRARETANATAEAIDEATGAQTRAEVGDESPVQAVEDALRTFDADEVVVVERDPDDASWLEAEARERIAKRLGGHPVRSLHLSEMNAEQKRSETGARSPSGSDSAPPDVPAPPAPDPAPTPRPGDPVPRREPRERLDPGEPTGSREPTGQTGSATEQYAGAGSTPDDAPELESRSADGQE